MNYARHSRHHGRRQVFWKLLSNAVKFMPEGGRIEVLLKTVSDFRFQHSRVYRTGSKCLRK